MRPLSGSDLAELARYPTSLEQTIVALCGVAPGGNEREAVPGFHTTTSHQRLTNIHQSSGA